MDTCPGKITKTLGICLPYQSEATIRSHVIPGRSNFFLLTLVFLNPDMSRLAYSVDPDPTDLGLHCLSLSVC